MSTPAAFPHIAPATTRPALDSGRPYGSPFVPLRSASGTPTPSSGPGRTSSEGSRERGAALTAEAEAWVEHATTAGMDPATALRKALSAVGFSIRNQAKALAIPSKLRGVAKHQDTVARLAALADGQRRDGLGLRLHAEHQRATDDHPDQISVGVRLVEEGGDLGPILPLGFVQDKHVAWLAPLLSAGATVCLSAVTGRPPHLGGAVRGRTMGVNVLFGFVGLAIQARQFQVGEEPSPSGDDLALYRTREGDTEVRFERGGQPHAGTYEWGYVGQGSSRLALAILRRFTCDDEAQRLAYDFVHEVVAQVPRAGVRIEAGFVRSWIASRSTN